MKLFIQLIATECLNDVAAILYSCFINREDEEEALASVGWRTMYRPQYMWSMLLSEITAPVTHINNRDNNLSTRLLLLEANIPYTGDEAMVIVNKINTAIIETGWEDYIIDDFGSGDLIPRTMISSMTILSGSGRKRPGKNISKTV